MAVAKRDKGIAAQIAAIEAVLQEVDDQLHRFLLLSKELRRKIDLLKDPDAVKKEAPDWPNKLSDW